MLVVLGWNEAMAVLFNPLYFTIVLVGLASAYVHLRHCIVLVSHDFYRFGWSSTDT
jgi:hypothetical protein